MNKNVRLIVRCVIFLLIFSVLMAATSFLFLPKSGNKNYRTSDMAAYGIDNEPKNSIDVLIVGDSETYSSISPMRMWEERGFTSYVCATSGQFLFDSYDFIEKTFKTQSPKVVILETNAIYRKFNMNNYIGAEIGRKIPIIKFHDRWKLLRPNDFIGDIALESESAFKGYIPHNEVEPAEIKDYMKKTKSVAQIPKLNQDCLQDIIALCKAHNTELIFVSTPSIKNWSYRRHNGVAAFAKKNKVAYLDMNLKNKIILIDWTLDTRDRGDHLNISGATKVSSYLSRYLDKKYKLPDHRKDIGYLDWNKLLEEYKEKAEQY